MSFCVSATKTTIYLALYANNTETKMLFSPLFKKHNLLLSVMVHVIRWFNLLIGVFSIV